MKVSPSVTRVVSWETLGRVMVSEPMMTTPELEMMVCPSGAVVVSGPDGAVVLAGSSVNVSPSVTKVLSDNTIGKVTVSEPIITTPELEMIVCPSAPVVVSGPDGGSEVELGGSRVNVSPPIVKVLSDDTVGNVNVSEPMMTIPELEMMVCPSGAVVVTAPVGRDEAELGGSRVKVSPSVTKVLLDDTVGSVTVSVPMMTTPELDTMVCPSGAVIVVPPGLPLEPPVAMPDDGGLNVNTSPSVVIVVGCDTLGIGIVSVPPIMRIEPLDTTTCPSDSVNVLGSAVTEDEAPPGTPVGWKVNVCPSVVRVNGTETLGTVKVSLPITMTEPLETTVCPSGSVHVVASTPDVVDEFPKGGLVVDEEFPLEGPPPGELWEGCGPDVSEVLAELELRLDITEEHEDGGDT